MQTESRTIKLAWNCYAKVQLILYKDNANREQNNQARLELLCQVQLILYKDNAKAAICGTRNWLKFNGYANGGQNSAANVVRYFVHFVMPGVGGICHVTSDFVGYRR